MIDQPRQQQQQPQPGLKTFGAQPAGSTGLRRLAPWMMMGATGGTAIALVMYGTQLFLPDHYKPAVVAGTAAGETVRAEIETMKEAKIDLARREADATAQANAKAQTDVAVATALLQQRIASQEGMTNMANGADVLCMLGQAAAAFTAPTGNIGGDWRRPDMGSDFNHGAKAVASVTCGMSNGIREAQTANMLDAVRTTAAARGMPMTTGAYAVNAAPVPAAPQPVPVATPPRALPTTLAEVFAIATPSRQWPWDYVMKARAFIKTLPQPTQDQLFAGLNGDDGWNVLVDRVQAYQLLPDAPLATVAMPAPVRAAPMPTAPVQVITTRPVETKPAPVLDLPSRFSVTQQGQLRSYSYGMPTDALRKVVDGLDMRHGYPDAWYERVAAFRAAHKG